MPSFRAGARGDLGGLERAPRRGHRAWPLSSPRRSGRVGSGERPSRDPDRCDRGAASALGAVRRVPRRLRRRAEVSPAPLISSSCCAPSADRRRRGARRSRTATLDGDGARRNVRPARRRLSPLLHRRAWLVPHFEKMLYDNARCAPPYLDAWAVTGEDRYRAGGRIDARLPPCASCCFREGGFWPSLRTPTLTDLKGATFVWTPEQIGAALGSG